MALITNGKGKVCCKVRFVLILQLSSLKWHLEKHESKVDQNILPDSLDWIVYVDVVIVS